MAGTTETVKVTLSRLFASREQWAKLARIPKSPKIAFKLARFMKRVLEENWQIIEDQRNEYIKQFSTSGEDETPGIDGKAHPEKLQEFMDTFDEYLKTEIEVKKIDMTMDELIDSMESNKGTVIDELVLMEIEDFFLGDSGDKPAKKRPAKKRSPAK